MASLPPKPPAIGSVGQGAQALAKKTSAKFPDIEIFDKIPAPSDGSFSGPHAPDGSGNDQGQRHKLLSSNPLIFINGILNSWVDHQKHAQELAAEFGRPVVGIYNKSSMGDDPGALGKLTGGAADGMQALGDESGSLSNPAALTAAGLISVNQNMHIVGHSQGSLITVGALKFVAQKMKKELKPSLFISLIGSQAVVAPKGPTYLRMVGTEDAIADAPQYLFRGLAIGRNIGDLSGSLLEGTYNSIANLSPSEMSKSLAKHKEYVSSQTDLNDHTLNLQGAGHDGDVYISRLAEAWASQGHDLGGDRSQGLSKTAAEAEKTIRDFNQSREAWRDKWDQGVVQELFLWSDAAEKEQQGVERGPDWDKWSNAKMVDLRAKGGEWNLRLNEEARTRKLRLESLKKDFLGKSAAKFDKALAAHEQWTNSYNETFTRWLTEREIQFALWSQDNSYTTPVGKIKPIFDKTAKSINAYYQTYNPVTEAVGKAGKKLSFVGTILGFVQKLDSARQFVAKYISKLANVFKPIPLIGDKLGAILDIIGGGLELVDLATTTLSKIGKSEDPYSEETLSKALAKNPGLAAQIEGTNLGDRFIGEKEGDFATFMAWLRRREVGDEAKGVSSTMAKWAKWIGVAATVFGVASAISFFVAPPAAPVLSGIGLALTGISMILNPSMVVNLVGTAKKIGAFIAKPFVKVGDFLMSRDPAERAAQEATQEDYDILRSKVQGSFSNLSYELHQKMLGWSDQRQAEAAIILGSQTERPNPTFTPSGIMAWRQWVKANSADLSGVSDAAGNTYESWFSRTEREQEAWFKSRIPIHRGAYASSGAKGISGAWNSVKGVFGGKKDDRSARDQKAAEDRLTKWWKSEHKWFGKDQAQLPKAKVLIGSTRGTWFADQAEQAWDAAFQMISLTGGTPLPSLGPTHKSHRKTRKQRRQAQRLLANAQVAGQIQAGEVQGPQERAVSTFQPIIFRRKPPEVPPSIKGTKMWSHSWLPWVISEDKESVQRSGDGPEAEVNATALHRDLLSQSAGSQPGTDVRSNLAPSLGYDFSDARIHTGPPAVDAARNLNARAFTIGSDIFFGEGQYQPGNTQGQSLLGHELTHVVQQSQGLHMYTPDGGDALEREAREVEQNILAGSRIEAGISIGTVAINAISESGPVSEAEYDRLNAIALEMVLILRRTMVDAPPVTTMFEVDVDVDLENKTDAEAAQAWATAVMVALAATPRGDSAPTVQRSPIQRQLGAASESDAAPNRTGLPDNLKSGIENLSGMSMDDVRVHYNSPAPAQVRALAYAQGSNIHVAPGQERHLPHEAWHVVQQAQGRVQPTRQLRGAKINDDDSLETEADIMGARALSATSAMNDVTSARARMMDGPIQREGIPEEEELLQREGIPEEEELLQREGIPEEEEPIQREGIPEEEELLQREGIPEEEELLQREGIPEEEEPIQREGIPEEEELLQREGIPEEEELLQREGIPEEEELLQREGIPEEEELLQREGIPEEEELLQREGIPEEEELLQREGIPEEEELLQREGLPEEEEPLQLVSDMSRPDHRTVQRKSFEPPAGLEVPDGDAVGHIFDSKIAEGKKFLARSREAAANYEDAIAAYTTLVRPIGNAVSAVGFTDTDLNFQNSLPASTKWGQKKSDFVKKAKEQLRMPAAITVATNPDREYWEALSTAAKPANRNLLKDNPDVGLIDPFLVNVAVGADAAKWEFLTQFADSGVGYIIRIKDGTHNVAGDIKTRDGFRASKEEAVGGREGYVYSSTHKQEGASFASRIATLGVADPDSDQKGKHHEAFDAITWLAAEGARFEPIRKLGGSGSPESHFFVKPNEDNWEGAKSVTTSHLMQNWGEPFERRYGITADEVAGYVDENGTEIAGLPAGSHFNLTKDEKHVVE
ncbi:MAG: eCIS core domain-containing protein [Fimbriimonas sp.]